MLNRWCNEINCINKAFHILKRIAKKIIPKKEGRGRNPGRNIIEYSFLIVLKEFDKRTLRGAEMHLSRLVFDERIDHSVISYWENKTWMRDLVAEFVCVAGAMLNKALSSIFTFVDATKFTSWHIKEINIHVCNRISEKTVYPIGMSFQTDSVSGPVHEAVPFGEGLAYLDAGYDDNKTIGVMFQKGYTPIVCPNKSRYRGYWRRKARKLYRMPEHRLGYRQRGRGESLFGSLTNCYGDRLHARTTTAMQTRIAARILGYQIKLLIRINNEIILIFRHALLIRACLKNNSINRVHLYFINQRR